MSRLMIVGDTFAINFFTYLNSQAGVMSMYFRVTATTGNVEQQQLLNNISTSVAPLVKAASCGAYQGATLDYVLLTATPRRRQVRSAAGAGPTTKVGTAMPGQVSGLITRRTGVAGRRGRGRTYVPFPAEADMGLNGRPGLAYLGQLNPLAAYMLAPGQVVIAAGQSVDMIGCLRTSSVLGPVLVDLVDAEPGIFWATQRRRGNYGRVNAQFVA